MSLIAHMAKWFGRGSPRRVGRSPLPHGRGSDQMGRGANPSGRGADANGRGANRRRIQARYDAAQTVADNRRHWANADALSADAANSAGVRSVLRKRARYERANNSWFAGMVLTVANDCIGTGPRLQILTGDRAANREIERQFDRWMRAVGLDEKLRTLRMAAVVDGEAVGLMTTYDGLRHPVKLDLRLMEADQLANSWIDTLSLDEPEAIELDPAGRPKRYHLLDHHPGGKNAAAVFGDGKWYDAAHVLHYFRADRAGQHRGVPEITPALSLYAELRRFRAATIAAAETAADFAAVIQSDAAAAAEGEEPTDFDLIELERRMATVLPAGWKLGQIQSQHPATTYQMFTELILNEIGRCLNMPFNVAAGNSAKYNYASGRMDHQVYRRSVRVDRRRIESLVLDRLLAAWLDEAVRVENFLPQPLRMTGALDRLSHTWRWDAWDHVDPVKEAKAQETRLSSGTTTLAREIGEDGDDWEDVLAQQAEEMRRRAELGLPTPAWAAPKTETEEVEDDAKVSEKE